MVCGSTEWRTELCIRVSFKEPQFTNSWADFGIIASVAAALVSYKYTHLPVSIYGALNPQIEAQAPFTLANKSWNNPFYAFVLPLCSRSQRLWQIAQSDSISCVLSHLWNKNISCSHELGTLSHYQRKQTIHGVWIISEYEALATAKWKKINLQILCPSGLICKNVNTRCSQWNLQVLHISGIQANLDWQF